MTRELLSEVLSKEVEDFQISMNNLVISIKGDGIRTVANIHELAHKCKEWAFYKDRWISSTWANKSATVTWGEGKSKTFKHCGTEPEAIFKACEWILEQRKVEL